MVEAVLFDGGLPVAPAESDHDLVPIDVVLALDPGITERAVFECGVVQWPIPSLLSFYAGFYSIHGGKAGYPNEMDEDRGGLVIKEWVPGAGNVIATRTYSRAGPLSNGAKIREETTLELRWAE